MWKSKFYDAFVLNHIVVLVQTAAPVDVLKAAIVDLQGETEALDRGFRDGVAAVRERQMQI